MRSCLPALLLLGGCMSPSEASRPIRALDEDVFVAKVQPILAERCGNPTCHGRPDRPLSIYSPLRWRADPERTFFQEELSDEELNHNFSVSSVFASETESPEEALLLRKALGEVASTYHGGGVVIEATSDHDYFIMLRWVQTGWAK